MLKELVLGTTIAFGGAACAAPAPTPKPEYGPPAPTTQASEVVQIYHGPLNGYDGNPLDGYPFLPDQGFGTLTQSLISTDDKLLIKTANDITLLRATKSNPPEFSQFVSEDSSPLPIIRTQSGASQAASASRFENTYSFILDDGTKRPEWPFIEPTDWGIELAAPPNVANDKPLIEAMYLAKETLSLLLAQRVEKHASEFIPQNYQFLSLNGAPLTDQYSLEKAEYTVVYREDSDSKSELAMLLDGLPVLMLAPSIDRLIQSGELPMTTNNLSRFYAAANYLTGHPQAEKMISEFNQAWINGGELTGSDSVDSYLLNPALRQIVMDFYPHMLTP